MLLTFLRIIICEGSQLRNDTYFNCWPRCYPFLYLLLNSDNRLQILQKNGPALTAIEERLSEKIRVEYLAEALLLSVHRFSVVFKSIMNVSLHQYILKRRLDRAMLLLANSSDSIRDIAVATGFYD